MFFTEAVALVGSMVATPLCDTLWLDIGLARRLQIFNYPSKLHNALKLRNGLQVKRAPASARA